MKREPQWLTVAEAARLAGVPVRSMRKRLRTINAACDGKLLRKMTDKGQSWWRVNRRVFAEYMLAEPLDLEREQESVRSELEHHAWQIDSLKRRVRALERAANGGPARTREDRQ